MLAAINSSEKTCFGSYRVERSLGKGGMGQVFLARHRHSHQEVVIKVLHVHLATDALARGSFLQEMKTLAQFRHPHAVLLLEACQEDPPYLVMEYVPGLSVHQLSEKEGPLTPRRVGRIVGQIASVLHAAHHLGILHRDLTATNVMLMYSGTEQECVKVMDFGLARPGGDGFFVPLEKLTSDDGLGPGTPDYISPEQIRREKVDHRADLYSLGVLMFKMLSGQLPFEATTDLNSLLRAQEGVSVPEFAELGIATVPHAVEALVRECLAKYPQERPQTAQEVATRFQEALGEKVLADDAFPLLQQRLTVSATNTFDPATVLDRLQAWMPEAIAAMKLRGFIEAVGGEVVESVPGMIGMRLLDPHPPAPPPARGWLNLLGFGARSAPPRYIALQLHLEKKEQERRSLVEIAVTLPQQETDGSQERQVFVQNLCRELRAYLMIG